MNKQNKSQKISSLLIWFSFSIMIISFVLMWLKSHFILKNINKPLKINHLQNFKTNSDFENLIEQVNPTEIDNLLDFYYLDYFFMVGYVLFLILAIYKIKYILQDRFNWNSTWFHKFHILFVFAVGLTLIIDILENWQLIYQTKYLYADLIESCFYYFRYTAKYVVVLFPILYILIYIIYFLLRKLKLINK